MDDEELKKKYKKLAQGLTQIKTELISANDVFIDTNRVVNNTVRINKNCAENNSFQNIKNIHARNINSITSTISKARSKS